MCAGLGVCLSIGVWGCMLISVCGAKCPSIHQCVGLGVHLATWGHVSICVCGALYPSIHQCVGLCVHLAVRGWISIHPLVCGAVCPSGRAGPGVRPSISVRGRVSIHPSACGAGCVSVWPCGAVRGRAALPAWAAPSRGCVLVRGGGRARRGARVGVSPARGGDGSATASRRLQGAGAGTRSVAAAAALPWVAVTPGTPSASLRGLAAAWAARREFTGSEGIQPLCRGHPPTPAEPRPATSWLSSGGR